MKKKIWVYTSLIVLLDQISKIIVSNYLNKELTIIPNFFSITKVHNTGGAWGIFGGNSLILACISLIVLLALISIIVNDKKITKIESLFYSFILGGILGNFIDRIIRTYVIDFLSFNIFGYDFPVFNIADIFIVVGVFIYVLVTLKEDKNGSRSK